MENVKKIIGIIAGYGELPVLARDALKASNYTVKVYGAKGLVDKNLKEGCAYYEEFEFGQLRSLFSSMKKQNISNVLFAGKIEKKILYDKDFKLDFITLKLLIKLKNRSDDSIMLGLIKEFHKKGFEVISQKYVLSDLLIKEDKVLSKLKPTASQMEDIKYGFSIAKKLGEIDIGQTVVIKDKSILALEAIEGTDEAIKRGCILGGGSGSTIVKVSKPKQDSRFDIPTIGMKTLLSMKEHGGSILAIETGSTFIIGLEDCIKFANENKIVFLTYKEEVE